MSKIDVRLIADHLRVYINDILHLSIDIRELVGIQSYKYGDYKFAIDYNMKTTLIETWYTHKEDWEKILQGLEKIELI
jgi:hypothetical protein